MRLETKNDWRYLAIAFALPVICFVMELMFGNTPSDSSVFRYIGWRMSCGACAYTEVWDCKGPILLLLNELGYILLPSGDFGPGLVFLVLWIASLLLLRRIVADINPVAAGPAVLAFSAMGVGVGEMMFQNCQEIVAVLFALCAWSVESLAKDVGARKRSFVVGLCVGGAFMTKANLAASGLALAVKWLCDFMHERDRRLLTRRIVFSALGFISSIGSVCALFLPSGLRSMLDGWILYNLLERCIGVEMSWSQWWLDYLFAKTNYSQFPSWCLPLCVTGSVLVLATRIQGCVPFKVWLVAELVMAVVSKGFWNHYLTVAFVPLSILVALNIAESHSVKIMRHVFVAWLAALTLFNAHALAKGVRESAMWPCARNAEIAEIGQIILPGTRVVACGSHGTAELMTRLRLTTPQKYVTWLFWINNTSQVRKQEIQGEFHDACADDGIRWLLTDIPIEEVGDLARPDTRRLLDGFTLYRELKNLPVHIYVRRTLVSDETILAPSSVNGGKQLPCLTSVARR